MDHIFLRFPCLIIFYRVLDTVNACIVESEICCLLLKGIEFYSGRHLICWQSDFLLLRLVSRICKGGSKAALIKGLEPSGLVLLGSQLTAHCV